MMSEEQRVEAALARAMHDPARDPVAEANGYRDTMPEDDAEVLGLARGEIAWLREAVRRLTQDAWRPIESAPKDGTDVLLFVESTGEQFIGYWGDGDWIYAMHGSTRIVCEPTHWQPLPSPPSPALALRVEPQSSLSFAATRFDHG